MGAEASGILAQAAEDSASPKMRAPLVRVFREDTTPHPILFLECVVTLLD
jgi:hypothetical protein